MYKFHDGKMIKSRAEKYPLEGMQVGDSFQSEWKNKSDIQAAAKSYGRKTGFIFRVVEFKEENYCVCGRIK